MQLSLLGWPPLLSHCLAFIVGTLVLQRSEGSLRLPVGKIMIPVEKLGRLETDGKSWKQTERITQLLRKAEGWCRSSAEELKLWQGPGRGAGLYLLWPASASSAAGLQQLLQKKIVLTARGSSFAYCGSEPDSPAAAGGIHYD